MKVKGITLFTKNVVPEMQQNIQFVVGETIVKDGKEVKVKTTRIEVEPNFVKVDFSDGNSLVYSGIIFIANTK